MQPANLTTTGSPENAVNPWYRLAAFLSACFIVTILSLVAALLGDPRAPAARWLDRNAGVMLGLEVLGIVICGVCAMARDRGQIRPGRAGPQAGPQAEAESSDQSVNH